MSIHHRVSIMCGFICPDCVQEILNYEPDLEMIHQCRHPAPGTGYEMYLTKRLDLLLHANRVYLLLFTWFTR